MRFSVKCNHCGQTFIAETQNYGRMKYRCPYCQSVMVCQFDPPKVFRTRARAVIPVADTTPVTAGSHLPVVSSHPVAPPTKETPAATNIPKTPTPAEEAPLPKARVHQFKKRAEGFMGLLLWIWGHLSVFCLWSSRRIRQFQEDYEDGDLWIFFAFSLLFVVLVGVGLWTMAEVTSLIAEGNSWLHSTYYSLKNIL